MLALDDDQANQAAGYSVIVSNATGVAASAIANLVVTPVVAPAVFTLKNPGSNTFDCFLNGEAGRYWRVESSSDLTHWSPESSFPTVLPLITYPSPPQYRSVVYTPSTSLSISVPRLVNQKFLRASAYAPANAVCNNNLKRIRFAKRLWTLDWCAINYAVNRNSSPPRSDLEPYLPGIENLHCPIDVVESFSTSYTVATLLINPACHLSFSHILEEP
jgi:hypothetical protein